jgi:hypothetical protein
VSAVINGARIALRAVEPNDIAEIEAWWPEAVATVRGVRGPVAGDGLSEMIGTGKAQVIVRSADPAPIGLIAYRVGLPAEGWLTIDFVALAAGKRGWGYGSEAVRLVEATGLARRFLAEVSTGNGLGVYFWLRMGYRPATAAEAFWQEREPDDIITMIRAK